jgi:hypothetical protein
MLGINLEKMAEAEFGKLETAVLSSPEFAKMETKLQLDLQTLKAFEAKITPAEIEAALNVLFPGKFTPTEVTSALTTFGDVISVISNPQAVLADIKKAL